MDDSTAKPVVWQPPLQPQSPSLGRRVRTALGRLLGRSEAPASRTYRFLAQQIRNDFPERTTRTILLSCTSGMETANETLLLLAHALSDELRARVLVVDGTFTPHGISASLGVQTAAGLVDYLSSPDRRLANLVQGTSRLDIDVLPAGAHARQPVSPLNLERSGSLLEEARGRYDYVLVQQSAIIDDSRYLLLAARADLVLVVVEEGVSLVETVDRCLDTFRDQQISNVRIVLCEQD